jgi:pimeloyl-ACP methyl ester carboxylesterase
MSCSAIQANGIQVAYEESGSGQPLLFIHGYPLNRAMWAPQRSGLANVARVLAPDLRGYGETQATPGPYSMDLLADDCAAFLDALDITTPVVVCGLSMGGYVALAFNRRHARRLGGLILTSTRAAPDSPEARQGRDTAIALAQRLGVAEIARTMLPKLMAPETYTAQPELVRQVQGILEGASLAGIVGALQGMRDRPDFTPTLAEIRVPALVVHGQEDRIIPVQEAQETAARIPKARLAVIPGAGHLPNLEQPDYFNAVVTEFIKEL